MRNVSVYELHEFAYAEITDPDLVGFMGQQACTLEKLDLKHEFE